MIFSSKCIFWERILFYRDSNHCNCNHSDFILCDASHYCFQCISGSGCKNWDNQRSCNSLYPIRPLSVPFLFRASGKGTDMATMLRLEKYGRIKFSLWKWASTDQNALKCMRAYAKGSGTFGGTDFRSFFRSWQLVF